MPSLNYIPQYYVDAYLNFGQDLQLSSTLDLLMADGSTLSEQRIIRRLMTNPLDYIWYPEYGAGIASYIGQPFTDDTYDNIQNTILSNMFLENTVSQMPQPDILFQTIQTGIFVQINYTISPSLQPIVLTFSVGGNT
jgi:hypothetical protein